MAVGDSITSGFNPSTFSLGCGFVKTDDSVSTTPDQTCTAGTLSIDGKYNIYFRRRLRETKQYEDVGGNAGVGGYRLYTAGNKAQYLTGAGASTAEIDLIEFVMCTNIIEVIAESALTGVIDKESVPIVADGANGTQGSEGPAGRDVGENLIDGTGKTNVITASTPYGSDSSSRWYSGMFSLNDVYLQANMSYSCQMRIKLEGCDPLTLKGRNVRLHLNTKGNPEHYPFICEFNPTENGTYTIKKENFHIGYASEGFYSAVTFGWDLSIGGDISLGTITIDKVKLEAGEKCTTWCLSENDKRGENTPYYHDTDYGWSASVSTAAANTDPGDVTWARIVPSKPADKPYLWMRDRVMTWSSSARRYVEGSYTYTRITGENGTGVQINGSFTKSDWYGRYDSIELYLRAAHPNPTTGDCYIYQEDGHLWVWNGATWQDVGRIKGTDGTSQYIHWAWCNILGPTDEGDEGYPDWTGLNTGFTTSKDAGAKYKYLGVLANDTESPDPDERYAGYYEWNEVQGPEGTSPWIADFDNEMDSVSCDEMGHPVSEQTVRTKLSYYYGEAKKDFKITSVTRNGSSLGTGVTLNIEPSGSRTYGSPKELTVTYGKNATISGKDDFAITMVAADNGSITQTLHFTVNGVIGDVYNILPWEDQIVAKYDGTTYKVNGSTGYALKCGYTKNVDGDVATVKDVTDGVVDSKYYIFYRKRRRSDKKWENWDSTNNRTTYDESENFTPMYYRLKNGVTSVDINICDAFEIVLTALGSGNRDGFSVADIQAIDRETVYVISDGADGTDGRDLGENIIDNSEPPHSVDVTTLTPDGRTKIYGNVKSYGYNTDKTYVPGKMPVRGTVVSAQARITISGATFASDATMGDGTSLANKGRVALEINNDNQWFTLFGRVEFTADCTKVCKMDGWTLNNDESYDWTGIVSVRADNFLTGTITVERVKLEVGPKCSAWSLSENDKIGESGQNAIRLALDNEHEDFLYSKDSNGNDLLISPYGGATSVIHLYDGHEEKTTGFTLKVYDDYAGSWVNQTSSSASVNAAISGTTLNVVELRTNSAKVKVRAEYPMSSGKYYYAEFTANKTTGDKYDIIVNPNAIAFSTGETWTNKTISVSIEGVNAQGGRLTPTISTGNAYGKDQFRVFWGYVKPDGTIIKPSTASQATPANGTEDLKARSKTVNQTEANEYIGIYFELRLYTSSTDYRLCDYETVEIAKTVAGKDGWTYEVSNKSVIIDQDMDNESRWYFPEPIKFSVKKGNTPCVFMVTRISCTKEDSNDIIGWNGSGTQALDHPDGFPYDSYSITINSVNGSTATKAVLTVVMSIYDPDTRQAVSHTEKVEVYINRLGTFSRKTMKNVEQALGEAHVYSIDPVTGKVLDKEYLYKEVNSAKESVKTLSEITEHTVNLFPSVTSGWESENGGTSTVVYGDNYSIADSGTDLYSPVVTLEPNTTYCFSGYFGSAPSTNDFLYVLSAVGNYAYVSDLFRSSALSPGSIINNGGGRYYFTFATPDDDRRKMFALNFFGSYQDLSRPQLEAGNAPTTFYPRVQAFSSEVRQTAREIEMKVGKCGIDINNQRINLIAGKVNFLDPNGNPYQTPKISINPITGTLTAVDGDFTGTITATGGSITGNLDVTGNGKLTVGTQHRIEISPDGSTWGAKIIGKEVVGQNTTQYLSLGFAYANNEFTPELLLGQPNVGSRIRITDEKIEQYLNISSTEGYTIEQGHFGSGTSKAGIIIKNAANKNVKLGIGHEGKVFIQADGWPVVNSSGDLSSIPVGSVCAMAAQALGSYSIRTLAIRVS